MSRSRRHLLLFAAVPAAACIAVYALWLATPARSVVVADNTPVKAASRCDAQEVPRENDPPSPAAAATRPMPAHASSAVSDPLLAQGRYAEAYAADVQAANNLVPGALYRLDAVLAACNGIPRNETQYQQWLTRHAGDESPAFDYMRKMMSSCTDVPEPTFQELSKLFLAYADQGRPEGYYMLGLLYPVGNAMGEIWLQKAAAAGNADAAAQLGDVGLQQGNSEQDRTEAYKWYLVSQSLGNAGAGVRIDSMAAALTPEDVSQARREATEILAPPGN